MKRLFTSLMLFTLFGFTTLRAAEPEQCTTIRFADVGWTDITVTTALSRWLFNALGYQTEVERLSIPDSFAAMANKEIDVFLGNWMPSMTNEIKPYAEAGRIETVRANLEGAKYTLAVPQYVYDAGVKTFADIAKNADKFDSKIYGIEPGNDGNQLIKTMIDRGAFSLGGFTLVESSESIMLAHVKRKVALAQWIVFLGWEPHPMNTQFKMRYLDGGDEFFGPNLGGATIYTTVRQGYTQECPNIGKLLSNLSFTLDMENQLMDAVLNQSTNPRRAARDWLKTNPHLLEQWLHGVQLRGGGPALAKVTEELAL
ncbi:glycine betaine/proline transport system substrate-binding protein [Pseudomonas duriflava]|uniref:Glycine betaine/proline transport system substrate-binding protein n=1 Tax=Pseudomonas duriflava TaxID=459528 RepID=A0A562QIE6_9PSED|nr:choline ABC transporter substrate-binding protein [Pseudomonas duriflava]TWI56509.1 glycine betaine/proline transport system substrate-binding protein [Pseudomonas duriflava]